MSSIPIQGHIDEEHRLLAVVPNSVPPGPVTIWISSSSEEDTAGKSWMAGIGREWADELADTRQDIYTLADGEAVDPS